MIVDTYGVPTY
jgi:V-type H+-transporting ATPase subunit a